MKKLFRKSVVLLTATALVMVPLAGTVVAEDQYFREDVSAEAMAADLLLIRPVGIIATVLGSALWVARRRRVRSSTGSPSRCQSRKE